MQEWEEKVMERQKALEEGAQGKLKEQIEKKLKKGKTPSDIAEEKTEKICEIIEMIESESDK